MFQTIRWGIPNVAAIVAMALMPLMSIAMPGQLQAVQSQLEHADSVAEPVAAVAAVHVEAEIDASIN